MIMQDNGKKPALRFKGFTDPWEQRKLGEICDFITKGATPTTYGFSWQPDGVPFFRNDSIKDNVFVFGEFSYISEAANEVLKRSEVHGNDILIAITGDIGKVGIIPDTVEKANINQHIARVRIRKEALPYFVYQYLASDDTQKEYQKIKTGLSMPQLSLEQVRDIVVKIPEFNEQGKIADCLRRIDTLITLHQRKYEKLVNIKKSMLDKMFPQNGASVPEIRFKGFTDPWEQRKLGEIAVFSKGVGYSKNDLCEEGTPIILYGRLYTKYETCIFDVDTFVKEKAGGVYSKGGEVIVPASGETAEDISIASVVVKPGILLGGDLNIVSPTAEYDSAFLALTISSGATHKYLSSLAQGKSVVHLHNADIQSVSAKFPTKREQEKIHLLFGKIDTLITLHQRKLEKLQNIKKSCLEKMFV